MARFIKIILVFLVPVLVSGVVMEVLLRQIPNRFKFQSDYINKKGDTIETLILGSSHSQFGIDPAYLEQPAFNLSNKSQTLDLDYLLLKKFERDLPNVKNVVIRLSYTTLFEKLSDGDESWRLKDYNIYMDADASSNFRHRTEILSSSIKENIRRLKSYYIDKLPQDFSSSLGWGSELSNKSSSKRISELGRPTAEKHTAKNFEYYDENVLTLEQIIQWCAKQNINVLLITMPAHHSYVQNLNKQQLINTKKVGQAMDAKYVNCTYLNYLDDKRFIELDFYDADHLNAKGAKKFSLLINELLHQ